MIKITIEELLNITPILRDLSNKPFKGSITFKIARLMRELDREISLFEDARKSIIEKYGVKGEDGSLIFFENNSIQIQEDKLQECNEEMKNLLITEIEINAEKISIEAFDDIEITPSQAIVLEILTQ